MDEIINIKNNQEIKQLYDSFLNAKPFPHVVIDSFFRDDFALYVLDNWPDFQGEKEKSNISDVRSVPNIGIILDELFSGEEFITYIQKITGIDGLIYDPIYSGGGFKESKPGATLPVHLDFNRHPHTGNHRRLNLLFYFNKNWQSKDGGQIEFHSPPEEFKDNVDSSYMPYFNRCIIFETSEHSWHKAKIINTKKKTRKTFALYYFTNTRPQSNEVTFRQTTFIEDPAPVIREGEVADNTFVSAYQSAIQKRNMRIKILYDRINELEEHIYNLRQKEK